MSETYDFGAGPVPAHQHPNGGGWVADAAYVAPGVWVGPAAGVAGGDIRGGTIRGGVIWGGTILGGTIWGGTIQGGTIWGGTIQGGTIQGGTIQGGTIQGGTIRGDRDVMFVGPVGSEHQIVTLVRDGDSHLLGIGCWHGYKIDDMAAEVQRRVGDRPELVAEYAITEALLRVRLAEWGQA